MCPVCKEVFRNRSDLTEHKAKTGHQGGAIIYTEPEKKTITTKTSWKNPTNTKKPNRCPVCDKRFKTKKSLESHQKDKKHFSNKIEDSKKIETKTQEKLKVTYTDSEKEDSPIQKLGNGYVVITDADYRKIMESVETLKGIVNFQTISFELLPTNNSWLVSYELSNETDWDYILFYCDFVEIEHTLESFMSLESKLNLDNKPAVFDLASLQSRAGVSNEISIYQNYDCLFITQDEDKTISYKDLFVAIKEILDSKENNFSGSDLLLIAGDWKKPVKQVISRPPTYYKKENKQMFNKPLGNRFQNKWTRKNDDWFLWDAEQEVKNMDEADSNESDKELNWDANPVYLITEEKICIDKLVNVKLSVN